MATPGLGSNLAHSLLQVAQNPTLRKSLEAILGDYCHQGRNRLNSLKLSLYLARRQSATKITPTWSELEASYQELETQIDRLQTVCRPMTLSMVNINLDLLFEDRCHYWSQLLKAQNLDLKLDRPERPHSARFDVNRMGTAFDGLVRWRAEQGAPGCQIRLSWEVTNHTAKIIWSESGSSNTSCSRVQSMPDSAWALPILMRVVGEHGGQLQVHESSGWHLLIQWPNLIGSV